MQKKIHTDSPKDLQKNQHLKIRTPYPIPANADCLEGYIKRCLGKGKFNIIKNAPESCLCFEKKSHKINRILKEVRTTKDKTTIIKDRSTRNIHYPIKKLIKAEKDSPKCNGFYYVCYAYNYPTICKVDCHCSIHPY